MTATIQTRPLIEQIKASREIYRAALENIESLTDSELRLALGGDRGNDASVSTVARVLSIASDDTVARVLSIASDDTVARVLSIASSSTVARVLSIASSSTVDRVLSIASDDTVARVLSIASDDTVARVTTLRSLVVPIVPDLDKRVLAHAEAGNLDMASWHCGTTHCRAGWAVTLGGDAGRALEQILGSEMAGRLIYEASTGRFAPDFYATNRMALEDLRRCANAA